MNPKKKYRPSVSVIIPFYNHEKVLFHAVESILAQTLPAQEILIVDDASSPDAVSILRKISSQVPSVRVIRLSSNRGPAAARNEGAQKATGEYLCFLDSDDALDPTFLEKGIFFLERKKDIDFVYSFIQHFGEDTQTHPTLCPYNFYQLLFHNHLPYCAVLRREAFEDVKGFDERLKEGQSEDWDFWIRMGKKDHFGYCIPEPLFYYRKGENKRLQSVRKNYENIVASLKKRHSELYRIHTRIRLWFRWRSQKSETPIFWKSRLFHVFPRPLKKIALKWHEAELTEGENWDRHFGTCTQLLIPVRWRRKWNQRIGRHIFHEKTKVSDVHFPSKKSEAKISSFPVPDSQKPVVFIVCPWLPMGGVETVLLTLLRQLSKNFSFVLFTSEKAQHSFHTDFSSYAAVYHLDHLCGSKAEKQQFFFEKIRVLRPQHLHIVNSTFGFKLLPTLKASFPFLRTSTSLHGWDKNFDFLSFAALYFSFLDGVVCVSQSVQKKFFEKLGQKSSKVQLIYNIPDYEKLDSFSENQKIEKLFAKKSLQQKNILFLGRYHFDKNPHFFVDIAHFFGIDLEQDHFRFFLFGEGIEKESLKKRAREINQKMEKDIVFVSDLQRNIASLYREADCLVNCSPREGFGMVALEAIYSGVPVVGYDLDVFMEVLPHSFFYPVSQKTESPLSSFAQQIFSATQNAPSEQKKKEVRQWVQDTYKKNVFFQSYTTLFQNQK